MLIDKWQLRIIQLFSVAGIVVAFYLMLFHDGSLVSACGTSTWFDCGEVSGPGAPYASIGPIPVALIGLIGYIAMFLAIWLDDWIPLLSDYLPEIMVGMSSLALVFTLWLTGLELFMIGAFCQYCVVSAVFIIIIFGLAISYLRSINSD
ncbi:MAG: hypothetical protein DWQ04_00110 [Chloroflexi bacterium]|nr:MAG: hypothetical protein DWQ04_00110 [Chloroflexota bacterium]